MSYLIKDTTRAEREAIIRKSLTCGEGSCEDCPSCSMGVGDTYQKFLPYIEGKKEIAEINQEYNYRYNKG